MSSHYHHRFTYCATFLKLVPDERRGVAELNGEGEVAGGIAMSRYGQNALEVIHNVKAKIEELQSGFLAGVNV